MIKINLLSYRDEKRKQLLQGQLIIGGIGLVPAILIILIMLITSNTRISTLNSEITKTENAIKKQKVTLKEIKVFKDEKEVLKNKMSVIEKLQKGKSGPVQIIDQLATNLPGRIWLTKLSQKGMSLTMEGKSLDNISIADYMVNLGKSKYFKSVDINKIQTDSKIGPKGVQLKTFSLTSAITYTPGMEDKKENKKSKKKKKKSRKKK